MTEEKENTFDFKQLLTAFNEDQKATVQNIVKQQDEQRLKDLQKGLQKKTTVTRKATVRPIDTKKLITQTTDNLKKALEIEKKTQNIEHQNNEMNIAKTIKLKAELNNQNENAKLKVNNMQEQRDKALEELNEKKKFFEDIQVQT